MIKSWIKRNTEPKNGIANQKGNPKRSEKNNKKSQYLDCIEEIGEVNPCDPIERSEVPCQ